MTLEEIIKYIEDRGGLMGLPRPAMYKVFKKIAEEMAPHYLGEMPKVLEDNFPNEEDPIKKHRKRVFRSISVHFVNQWKSDASRLVMGGRFQIKTSDRLGQYLEETRFSGAKFKDWLFKDLFNAGLSMPNGIIVPIPVEGFDASRAKDFESFTVFDFEQIVFKDSELIVLKRKPKTDSIPYQTNQEYLILSKSIYAKWTPAEKAGEQGRFTQICAHKFGDLPFADLPGHKVIRRDPKSGKCYEYTNSWLTYAVGFMDKFTVLDQQLDSTLLAASFPIRVTQGMECPKCEGTKVCEVRDEKGALVIKSDGSGECEVESCKTCSGSGEITFSPFKGIAVAPRSASTAYSRNDKEEYPSLANRFIDYASPPTEPINLVMTRRDKAFEEMKEALNIVKHSKVTLSGTAKEKDREGKYTELADVATGMANVARTLLEIIASIRYVNDIEAEKAAIQIVEPTSFDIISTADLRANYMEGIESKPSLIRYKDFMALISHEFTGNDDIIRIADLVVRWTMGLNLKTDDEVISLMAAGVVDKRGFMLKTAAFSTLLKLSKANNFANMKDEAIIALGNIEIDKMIAAMAPAPIEDPETETV